MPKNYIIKSKTSLFSKLFLAAAAMSVFMTGPMGCSHGTSQLGLVPVQGTVTLDGAPVSDASVTFFPENGPSAHGSTDENGRFSLTTNQLNDGTLPGHHHVVISKFEIKNEGDPYAPPVYLIPERFSSPATSGLEQTIPSTGKKDISITLTK